MRRPPDGGGLPLPPSPRPCRPRPNLPPPCPAADGKTGQQFAATLSGLATSVAATHTDTSAGRLYPALPVVVTEHAAHTSGDWGSTIPSTTDAPFEASRLASQMARGMVAGVESYIFKFSTTPSANGGVAKTGLHWADVTTYPYAMGDNTRSAAAARLVLKAMLPQPGLPRQVDTVTVTSAAQPATLTPKFFQYAASIKGPNKRYFLFVNDCAATTGLAADCNPGPSGSVNAMDIQLTLSLASWGLIPGTQLTVLLLSGASFGEVSQIVTLSPTSSVSVFSPANSVLLVVGPVGGVQTVAYLNASAGTTLCPTLTAPEGAAPTRSVGTSATADHSTTRVYVVQYAVPAAATRVQLSSAVMTLTLASSPTANLLINVFGHGCDAPTLDAATAVWGNSGWFVGPAPTAAITTIAQNFINITKDTIPR